MLIYGPMIQGHDTFEHLDNCRNFAQQFWSGEWYPRWLVGMHFGLGSASFFIYPPLVAYAYAFLVPAGKLLHFDAFVAQAFLALLASGICAALWLNTMCRRNIALLCAALYMLMPYHLAVDFYRRTAHPECWALAWMPLILYFSGRVMNGRGAAVLGLAISYALLVLSHPITLIVFSPIPLAAAATLPADGQKIKTLFRVVEGMALGTGLSCFYLLSALFDSRYFPAARLLASSNYRLSDNLMGIAQFHRSEGIAHTIALTLLDMGIFTAICAGVALWRIAPDLKKKIVFWIAVCGVSIFLMTWLSHPFWEIFSWLRGAVQLPWRLNIILCVALLPIVAGTLSQLERLPRFSKILVGSALAIIVTSWIGSYAQVWKHYRAETVAPPQLPIFIYNDDWVQAWSVQGLDAEAAVRASRGPLARFSAGGSGTLKILSWKPRHIEIQSDSPSGGLVMVNQFYYPQWRAAVIDSHGSLEVEPAMPEGLLQVQTPPGLQRIVVEIPIDAVERAGNWISAISVLLWMSAAGYLGAWRSRFRNGAVDD